jgi:GNAT superfamily N-acetyltransferase
VEAHEYFRAFLGLFRFKRFYRYGGTALLEYQTIDYWNDQIWEKAENIYHQAFEAKGAKSEKVLRNMFHKGIGFLHIGWENEEVVTVAISGRIKEENSVIIDYLAVSPKDRNKGIGRQMVNYIIKYFTSLALDRIIIEVEAEKSSENQARITFWERCGFTLTDYIHQYFWVPEPYQAMYLNLHPKAVIPSSGKELFSYIGKIHKKSFQGV